MNSENAEMDFVNVKIVLNSLEDPTMKFWSVHAQSDVDLRFHFDAELFEMMKSFQDDHLTFVELDLVLVQLKYENNIRILYFVLKFKIVMLLGAESNP